MNNEGLGTEKKKYHINCLLRCLCSHISTNKRKINQCLKCLLQLININI